MDRDVDHLKQLVQRIGNAVEQLEQRSKERVRAQAIRQKLLSEINSLIVLDCPEQTRTILRSGGGG